MTTKIEWCDEVWNPVTGCTKVSAGCRHCYAASFAARHMGQWKGREFGEVRCHEDRLVTPMHWRKPRKVFVNSMSDLFHKDVHREFLQEVFTVIQKCPQHTFMVLTKRAERMADEIPIVMRKLNIGNPLPNLWLGVSVEDQATADERIPLLLQTPEAVRWVSAEPLLGPINLKRIRCTGAGFVDALDGRGHDGSHTGGTYHKDDSAGGTLDWVVVGGESGPGARPFVADWGRSVVDQCAAAGVPCFFKQFGSNPYDLAGGEFKSHLQWVQKAAGWIGGTNALCFDAIGRPCRNGADFSRARDEGTFPVRWHLHVKLQDRKGGDQKMWPKWAQVRQWPERKAGEI